MNENYNAPQTASKILTLANMSLSETREDIQLESVEKKTLIAPLVRVEELREDGHSSAVSDIEDSMSDRGRSPEVSDQDIEAPSEELEQKIIQQVEFYFSDANILKDAFLLKHVKRNKQGFVSLKLVTSFRKMRSLTKDYRVVAMCLSKSMKLEVNDEGTKVRRVDPLPEYDETTPSRTVVAINLPFENPSIENVAELFAACGEISLIRILKPGKGIPPDIKKHLNKHPELGNSVCAVVEFENHLGAQKACETMASTEESQKGPIVSLLAVKKNDKPKSENNNNKFKKTSGKGDEHKKSTSQSSNEDQQEHLNQMGKKDFHSNKKNSKGFKRNDIRDRALEGGDSNAGSSDEEYVRRSSFGQKTVRGDMQRLTPTSTPRTTPRHTPKSSPRHSPNVARRQATHGKSPLAVESPAASPDVIAKAPYKTEGSPSPGCSPWLQRKLKAQQEASISPMASPRLGRRLLDQEGVVRQPRGPDGTRGFHAGVGRGKIE